MTATIIDGKAIAARVRAEVAEQVRAFTQRSGAQPGLATVLVGEDPASAVYVGAKQRACAEIGMTPFDERLPETATFEQVAGRLQALNEDPSVNGVLLQLPLPAPLDGPSLSGLIDPRKDVDGLTPVNAGLLALGRPGMRPCTPLGVIELLASVDAQLEGAEAVVVGRSNLFGKPMAQLLLEANATVSVCHSRTRDLREVCARADVLIAAVGRPRLIGRDFVKPGAIVIDVGMNRLEADPRSTGAPTDHLRAAKSKLVGDVDFEAAVEVARAITPVPGGVGPMTIAMLLKNTLLAACIQNNEPAPQGFARAGRSGR
jgi:methylenetetrahydrofolate dehydrogenase (NADP+)/methenyltetrahydrofolate cyclohydrolase